MKILHVLTELQGLQLQVRGKNSNTSPAAAVAAVICSTILLVSNVKVSADVRNSVMGRFIKSASWCEHIISQVS